MDRIALVGIIISDTAAVEAVNALLHEYAPYILGRMGVPYREKGLSIISVVIDAPSDVINAVTGKIGAVKGVNVKAQYAKI